MTENERRTDQTATCLFRIPLTRRIRCAIPHSMHRATDMELNMANLGWRIRPRAPITVHPRPRDVTLRLVPPIPLSLRDPLTFRVVERPRLRISRLRKVTHLA
jgi:hypothetical protein